MDVTEKMEGYLRGAIYPSTDPDDTNYKRRPGCWIDAICINQNDIEERNAQVKRMRDIYTQLSYVLVWLGKQCPGSDQAIDSLLSFGTQIIENHPITTEHI
jgi:Heterokaryon incompatibility protein (HET)